VRENDKPKKPSSGFLRFLTEKYKSGERGNLTYREFQSKIVDDWKILPEAKKAAYNEAFKKENEKYKIALTQWELKMIRLGNTDLVRQEALIEPVHKPFTRKPRAKKHESSDSD
jgi:transcription factor A, mitochondrial